MSGLLSSRPSFVTVVACAAVVSFIFCSHTAEAYPTIAPVERGEQPVLRSYKQYSLLSEPGIITGSTTGSYWNDLERDASSIIFHQPSLLLTNGHRPHQEEPSQVHSSQGMGGVKPASIIFTSFSDRQPSSVNHRPFVHSQNTEPSGFVAPNNGNAQSGYQFNWHPPIIRNSPNIQQERPLPQSASQSDEQFPKSGSTSYESRTKDKTAWQSPDYSPISHRTGRHWSSRPTSKGHDGNNNDGFAGASPKTSTLIHSQSSKFPSFSRQNAPVSSSNLDTSVFKAHPSPEKLTSSITHFSQGVFPARSNEKQNDYMKVQSYLLGNSQISDKPKGVIAAPATPRFQDNVYRGHDFSQQTETGQARTRTNLFNANANINSGNVINYQLASVMYRAPPRKDTPEKFEEANRNAKDDISTQVYAVPRGPIQQTETNQVRMRPSLFIANSDTNGTKVSGGKVINYQPASVIYRAPPRKDGTQKYEEASSANINAKRIPGGPVQQIESSYSSNGHSHWPNLKKNSQQPIISNREVNPEARGYRFMRPSSLHKYSFGQRIASSTLAQDKRTSADYSRNLLDATFSTTPKSAPFHKVPPMVHRTNARSRPLSTDNDNDHARSGSSSSLVFTNAQNELKVDPKPSSKSSNILKLIKLTRVKPTLLEYNFNVRKMTTPQSKILQHETTVLPFSVGHAQGKGTQRQSKFKAVTYYDILGSASFSSVTPARIAKERLNFDNLTTNEQKELVSQNWTVNLKDEVHTTANASSENGTEIQIVGKLDFRKAKAETPSDVTVIETESEAKSVSRGLPSDTEENLLELDYLRTSTGNVSFQSLNLNL